METNRILRGDSIQVLKSVSEETVDCIVTDPPYGYSFMNENWDKTVPSIDIWRECLRVLKSGAFMFVMSAPRQDVLSQMIIRLGQAGFNTNFTSIYWAYSNGFPKSLNISKAMDNRLNIKPEVVGIKELHICADMYLHGGLKRKEHQVTVASSEQSRKFEGSYSGFQPKPAVEIIIVCMKPLAKKTFVEQALKNGKGVTWLDKSRIPFERDDIPINVKEHISTVVQLPLKRSEYAANNNGRFPVNLLVSDDVLNDGQVRHKGSNPIERPEGFVRFNGKDYGEAPSILHPVFTSTGYRDSGSFSRYFDLDAWFEEAISKLPENVRKTFPFIICSKASSNEKNQGCEGVPEKETPLLSSGAFETNEGTKEHTKMKNSHPTVKPLKLMSYLITLGCREGDLILDPFVGSGTTCLAAEILNRRWLGIDINPEYCVIAEKRMSAQPVKLDRWFS